MINQLPTNLGTIWLCVFFVFYSTLLGYVWGRASCKFLFHRLTTYYTMFDIRAVGIGTLGTLMIFDWLVRQVFILVEYRHFQIGGWWVQIWIASFSCGMMLGYFRAKRKEANLLTAQALPPEAVMRVCPDCPLTSGKEDHGHN